MGHPLGAIGMVLAVWLGGAPAPEPGWLGVRLQPVSWRVGRLPAASPGSALADLVASSVRRRLLGGAVGLPDAVGRARAVRGGWLRERLAIRAARDQWERAEEREERCMAL